MLPMWPLSTFGVLMEIMALLVGFLAWPDLVLLICEPVPSTQWPVYTEVHGKEYSLFMSGLLFMLLIYPIHNSYQIIITEISRLGRKRDMTAFVMAVGLEMLIVYWTLFVWEWERWISRSMRMSVAASGLSLQDSTLWLLHCAMLHWAHRHQLSRSIRTAAWASHGAMLCWTCGPQPQGLSRSIARWYLECPGPNWSRDSFVWVQICIWLGYVVLDG
jgi:hypothetical protein